MTTQASSASPLDIPVRHAVEPTADELSNLWTAAIECEGIGGSSMETLYQLYEARMKKFSWIGKRECDLRFSLDKYLEHRGYQHPITTEIQDA